MISRALLNLVRKLKREYKHQKPLANLFVDNGLTEGDLGDYITFGDIQRCPYSRFDPEYKAWIAADDMRLVLLVKARKREKDAQKY